MPHQSRVVAPASSPTRVRLADGSELPPPAGWALLPPGDAALTRRVKQAGPSWTVEEKKGRKRFSHGVWAPAETIASVERALEAERDTPAYRRKLEAGRRRRAAEHEAYVQAFRQEVLAFLRFAPCHATLAARLAEAVTAHATPVGSGTVARTQRIAIDRRAEAAVIAWMRHQTTAYDTMAIARIRGRRREVRGLLAQRSRSLLAAYRAGHPVGASCPLQTALAAVRVPASASSGITAP